MTRQVKVIMPLLPLLVGVLSGTAALALDYQYEYEEDPAPGIIEEVYSLKKLAALARKNRAPLLIEFSTPWCSYCEALEKQVLEPMIKNGLYRDRVIIRKLEVADYTSVLDFTGKPMSSVDLAMSAKVNLYPTLVFYNGEGEEISHRLVGITVLEFVSDELEKALIQAQHAL